MMPCTEAEQHGQCLFWRLVENEVPVSVQQTSLTLSATTQTHLLTLTAQVSEPPLALLEINGIFKCCELFKIFLYNGIMYEKTLY